MKPPEEDQVSEHNDDDDEGEVKLGRGARSRAKVFNSILIAWISHLYPIGQEQEAGKGKCQEGWDACA